MAARLRRSTTERRVRAEEEARLERTRSLEARGALNARKGFVHALCVGEVDGAEHGAQHERRCETEAVRVGRARASVEVVGPRPHLRGFGVVVDTGCHPPTGRAGVWGLVLLVLRLDACRGGEPHLRPSRYGCAVLGV